MERIYEAGAVVLPPTAPVSPSSGYPTGGNPIGGVSATKPGAYWFHMVMEEMRAIIAAGGLTPDHLVLNQVLQALPAALASRPEMARGLTTNGHQKFPGGLILQWGRALVNASSTLTVTLPIAFPNQVFALLAASNTIAMTPSATPEVGLDNGITFDSLSQIRIQSSYTASTLTVGWFAIGR